MNEKINKVLRGIRSQLEHDAVGKTPASIPEAGSTVPQASKLSEALDMYLTEVADLIAVENRQSAEAATRFVFDASEALAKEGVLPTIPDDDALPECIAEWISQARSSGFAHRVMGRARGMFE